MEAVTSEVSSGFFNQGNEAFPVVSDIAFTTHLRIPSNHGPDTTNAPNELTFNLETGWYDFSTARLEAEVKLTTDATPGAQMAVYAANTATTLVALKNLPLSRMMDRIIVRDISGKVIQEVRDQHYMKALVDWLVRPLDGVNNGNMAMFFKDNTITNASDNAACATSAGFVKRVSINRPSFDTPACITDKIHMGWFESSKPVYGVGFSVVFVLNKTAVLELDGGTAKVVIQSLHLSIDKLSPKAGIVAPVQQLITFPHTHFEQLTPTPITNYQFQTNGAPVKRVYIALQRTGVNNDMISHLGYDATTYIKNVRVEANGMNYPDGQGYEINRISKCGDHIAADLGTMRMYRDFITAHGCDEGSAMITFDEWIDRYAIICVDCSRDRHGNEMELEQQLRSIANVRVTFSSAANLTSLKLIIWYQTWSKVVLDMNGNVGKLEY